MLKDGHHDFIQSSPEQLSYHTVTKCSKCPDGGQDNEIQD